MLSHDRKGKYAFILFYTAIIYHIANIMNAKKIPMPRYITFSGNGSKILNILSPNKATIVDFTKIIFKKVYQVDYPNNGLTIINPDFSKESTSKGGAMLNPFESQEYKQIEEIKTILLGTDNHTFAEGRMRYGGVNSQDIIDSTRRFIDFVFDLNNDFSFYQRFDVDIQIMDNVRETCLRDIEAYLEKGINQKIQMLQEDGADDVIEETFFFYPLVGILNAVVREVYNM